MTREELVERFGGASFDPGAVVGYWVQQETVFVDELIRVRVTGSRPRADDAFIRRYKEVLKDRFRQQDIFITATRIARF